MANDYTPQQIEEILQMFFDVAGTRQYIGARYVPIFGRGRGTPVEWDNSDAYEPLSIVYYQGDTYTSRRYVPAGIPIDDQDYWVITGRYNAQVEQYRQEVLSFQGQIDGIRSDLESDYVPFPDSDHYPKYGTLGQVLTTLADGETKWENPVVPSDAQAEAIISQWLDEHPEATTTVQDGSITDAKLSQSAGALLYKALKNNLTNYSFTDANNAVDANAIYYISSNNVTEHYPPMTGPCFLMIIRFNDSNTLQMAWSAYGNAIAYRTQVAGTWSDWIKTGTVSDDRLIINRLSTYSFTDANDVPAEPAIYYISSTRVTSNYPPLGSVCYLMTINLGANNMIQHAWDGRGNGIAYRAKVNGTWSVWKKAENSSDTDTRFTNLNSELYNVSSVAAFPNIGCCGDSFTAGYLYNKTDSQWYDPDYVPNGEYPAIGWPAVMGRIYGVNATAFAKGGVTTGTWRTDNSCLPALLADTPKNLYVLALGLNDVTQNTPVGIEADLDTEPMTPTFLGNYGAIIRAIQTHAPLAKIIICKSFWIYTQNTTTVSSYYTTYAAAIDLIAEHFGIGLIETMNDPFFCGSHYTTEWKGLHPTAPLYAGMGKRMGELIGECVIDNYDYFFNYYVPNN